MATRDNNSNSASPTGAIVGSIIGCAIVAAVLVLLISLAAAVYKHKKKHHSHDIIRFNNNHARIDGARNESHKLSEVPATASLPYVLDPSEPCHDYEKIPETQSTKLQSSRTDQVVKLTKLDSDCHPMVAMPYLEVEDHEYVIPAIEHCEHCLTEESKKDEIYWEPAGSINELYKQLCLNKYREIEREEVKIGVKLGSGQFGVVSKGVWESPKGAMDVAVKQLQSGASEEEKVKFLQEAAINGQFRHPNLVMLMGVVTVGEPVMIVLELLSNGDLKTFLIKCRPQKKQQASMTELDEQLLLKFCQQIASGMSYLAGKAFVHRDLAARNILVSKDKICKISDFGMSRNLVDEKYVSHGGIVPLKWMSPEAINYSKYSTASDVWSFGCVMYEIWSLGHRPFADLTNDEVLSAIAKGYRLPPPPGTSKELYKIMIQCWQPESYRRPTFPQLVELLSRADFELFAWEEEDLKERDPLQIKTIGAPLETAKNLYLDLQMTYITNN